ncbi:uncharacterized protein [Procambarus clarkii]|uniref:uncharacterized protein n=1 Tax=Procambarus clarkii TaxID=6728 RepID=UPI0037426428
METACNLQCWCHVPIRGRNKPPCYLCVLQDCSLSRKMDISPTAPPLSPEPQVEFVPSFPEPKEVLASSFNPEPCQEFASPFPEPQEVLNPSFPEPREEFISSFPEPQEVFSPLLTAVVPEGAKEESAMYGDASYGWRVTATTQASASPQAEGVEGLQQARQVHVLMQTEDTEGADEGASCTASHNPVQDLPSRFHFTSGIKSEESCSLKHYSREHLKALRKHSPPKLHIRKYGDSTPNEDINHEDNVKNKTELSELLKSLVLGADDNLLQDSATNLPDSDDRWLNENLNTRRMRIVPDYPPSPPWTYEDSLGPENTLRLTNRLLAASDDAMNIRSSRTSKHFTSTMMERKYKTINKIHRRESFAEAARRHQQNTRSQKRPLLWTQSGMF